MPTLPSKVDVKTCVTEPPHRCDPPLPCDPLKQPDGYCDAFLCKERLKNPETPDSTTRCRSGESIGVRACVKAPPPHPCDEPFPCSTFRSKKEVCDEPSLCVEKIKNIELRKTRWVVCTNSKGEVVQHRVFKDD